MQSAPAPAIASLSPPELVADVRARLAAGRLPMPTLPDLAMRIDALVGSPDACATDVAGAVTQDPAIAARLVHAANSAFSASRVRVQTVQAAVTRLGLAYTRALVHRLAVEQMFLARQSSLREFARRLWHRSLGVAALSEALARECTGFRPETAMLGGLLHMVGALPLIRLLDDMPAADLSPAAIDELVSATHPEIGRALLARWAFPGMLQEIPPIVADPHRHHGGAAEIADVVIVAVHGWLLHEGDAPAVAPISALEKMGLDAEGHFLDAPPIRQAHESARARLAV